MSITGAQSQRNNYGYTAMINSSNQETSSNLSAVAKTIDDFKTALAEFEKKAVPKRAADFAPQPEKKTEADTKAEEKTDKELKIEARDEWGRLMTKPSIENMEDAQKKLAELLRAAFLNGGIAQNPPVDLMVINGEIKVNGDRGDLEQIEEMVNNNKDIKENAEKLSYLTQEMTSFVKAGHLDFARAYHNSNNPKAVVAQYSHLFSGVKMAPKNSLITFNGDVSMSYNGEKITPDYFKNNRNWIESV